MKREIIVKVVESEATDWRFVAEAIARQILKGANNDDGQRKISGTS